MKVKATKRKLDGEFVSVQPMTHKNALTYFTTPKLALIRRLKEIMREPFLDGYIMCNRCPNKELHFHEEDGLGFMPVYFHGNPYDNHPRNITKSIKIEGLTNNLIG